MKRKTKILIGVALVMGLLVKKYVNLDVEIDQLEADLKAYDEGFRDGKNFHKRYHDSEHPDCDRCPH